jgi:hypothetical protein
MACGAVGASKTALNHSAVTGWKQAKGFAGGEVEAMGSAGDELGRSRGTVLSKDSALDGEEEAKNDLHRGKSLFQVGSTGGDFASQGSEVVPSADLFSL